MPISGLNQNCIRGPLELLCVSFDIPEPKIYKEEYKGVIGSTEPITSQNGEAATRYPKPKTL